MYKNHVLFFLMLFVMASVAFSQSANQQQENQKQKSVLDRLEQLEKKINELERLASIRANKIVAWVRCGEDTESCYRLHIKRIGRSMKFWASGQRGSWVFLKADGTLITTGFVPDRHTSFWNMPMNENDQKNNPTKHDFFILCLDTSITSQKQTPEFVVCYETEKLIDWYRNFLFFRLKLNGFRNFTFC